MTTERCDVVLERTSHEGKFLTTGLLVNGFRLPLVRKAEVISTPGHATVVRVEMFVTAVHDEVAR